MRLVQNKYFNLHVAPKILDSKTNLDLCKMAMKKLDTQTK